MRGLAGRTAIVTGRAGRASGCCRAICRRLAEEGCKVAIFDLNPEAADETVRLSGGGARAYQTDVSDHAAVPAAVAKAEADLGPTWLLVNNAGWDRPQSFLKTDRALWGQDHRHQSLRAAQPTHAPPMPDACARGWSSAAAAGSSTSPPTRRGSAPATRRSTRPARAASSRSPSRSARELARSGVLLNAVCPGPTNTPMMQSVLGAGESAVKNGRTRWSAAFRSAAWRARGLSGDRCLPRL